MTMQLVLGVDPGVSGAMFALADGEPVQFFDMPIRPRAVGSGNEVDVPKLQALLRGLFMAHRGAYVFAVLEKVGGHRGQGGSASFNFGQADGAVRATIQCQGIPILEVYPQTWKTYMQLTGKGPDGEKLDKGAALRLARSMFPAWADALARAKDNGRADALLIARWAVLTEQVGAAA